MHKYEDRYVKGGCAYWSRRHISHWYKQASSRGARRKIKIELDAHQEEFVGRSADDLLSRYQWMMWD